MSRTRLAALFACGAAIGILALVALIFQAREELDWFLVVVALQVALYLTAVWLAWSGGASWRVVAGLAALALLMRVPVALAPPYLSSDIYRYIWDGRIEAAGFNPYRYAPIDGRLAGLRDQDIFPQIASTYAPTIYPPAAEAIFLVVTRVSESVTAMKLAAVMFEIAAIALLWRLLACAGLPSARLLVYAWHPLPLWEFAGSGHIDAALVACCVAALWAVQRRRAALAGLFLASATLTKLYPIVLLPALYRRWDWRLPTVFVAAIVIAYLPYVSAGSQVLGFLPGYAGQEGFDDRGTGFFLLELLRRLPGLAGLSTRVYAAATIAALVALGSAVLFRRDRNGAPYRRAAALATLFMVVVSPHYPWYFCWLIVFACFVRSLALLWLTNACLLLYLNTEYAFVQSAQRMIVEAIIYGPFAALALVDFCYHRRGSNPRS